MTRRYRLCKSDTFLLSTANSVKEAAAPQFSCRSSQPDGTTRYCAITAQILVRQPWKETTPRRHLLDPGPDGVHKSPGIMLHRRVAGVQGSVDRAPRYDYAYQQPTRAQSPSLGSIHPMDRTPFTPGAFGHPFQETHMRNGEVDVVDAPGNQARSRARLAGSNVTQRRKKELLARMLPQKEKEQVADDHEWDSEVDNYTVYYGSSGDEDFVDETRGAKVHRSRQRPSIVQRYISHKKALANAYNYKRKDSEEESSLHDRIHGSREDGPRKYHHSRTNSVSSYISEVSLGNSEDTLDAL